ncbi:acyl-CoA dehydrogenase family protein [Salinicoccus roseus]|uniref:acyl-CoA dehydrogenase family protein n=1 Tax=Salinicoccus roseus TaxID=45670 RepID=UPI0023007FDB|nr:acyl-CoA dehydrogenase family protein [Salinicoccus roseus]
MKMIDAQITETVRRHAESMEIRGEMDAEVLELIYERRLFKLFTPKEVGGRMLDLPEALHVFEDAAWVDGSFGWLVQIGSGAGFFATVMEPDAVRELFTPRAFYIAGSDRPMGTARKVRGGYMIDGTWPFCSGAQHASLFTVTCRIASNDMEDGRVRAFALTPEQISVEKDWNAFGLKATSSHTIHVADAFVPESYRFNVTSPHFHFDHPVYHYPFMPFATANIASTAIGIARHFFEAARGHIDEKKAGWMGKAPERYRHVYRLLEENEKFFLHARKDFYDAVSSSWQTHLDGRPFDPYHLDAVVHCSKKVAKAGLDGAQVLHRHLGMEVLMEDHPLNHIYRDLHVASQHGLLVDDTGKL